MSDDSMSNGSMSNGSRDDWSLCLGRPGGVELRFHVLWPLTALAVVLLAEQVDAVELNVALWALVVFASSVALHELARVVTAARMGGHTSALVLGPMGGFTKLHLPADPPAHLVAALAGPMTYLVLLVTAGCGLALTGDRDVFRLLINPCAPQIYAPGSVAAVTPLTTVTTLELLAQLTVWINWCLLLISFLPVDPCSGAELLRGILWPMLGRTTATSATSRIAIGAALFVALLAVVLPESLSQGQLVPWWFPLSVISVCLLYGGARSTSAPRYDVGLAIDEFDSDDEDWLLNEWDDRDRQAVLVEHLQDKQQEVIDRKRREREAHEDARVDAILLRLRNTSFEQLSEEDRATLKRASRRYRARRDERRDDG